MIAYSSNRTLPIRPPYRLFREKGVQSAAWPSGTPKTTLFGRNISADFHISLVPTLQILPPEGGGMPCAVVLPLVPFAAMIGRPEGVQTADGRLAPISTLYWPKHCRYSHFHPSNAPDRSERCISNMPWRRKGLSLISCNDRKAGSFNLSKN